MDGVGGIEVAHDVNIGSIADAINGVAMPMTIYIGNHTVKFTGTNAINDAVGANDYSGLYYFPNLIVLITLYFL